ncbi:TetR/AcrR family transcriptional regulator [Wenyingzhuangia sp. chi5]|uniref:TetR/AcrR family transcriptional regulator n=1 Tax=Wenyingzhuangia gilva TaxID=3057677 RepID=A0ABT8VTU9_9FLAO|nr:TetR/AcrR family transcriptional regulator [Wenyingzhuangia sp. chi5]MDO3695399.1 TetR/AcrR family transcriptional regulator [Wenyingzhuangia sp. chi5]
MKDKILTTATSMFLDLGFKSVTMDDISNTLGISKKTVYSHFKNKNKLVEATTLNIFNNILQGINAIENKKQNSIEELFQIKELMINNVKQQNPSSICQLQKFFPEIHSCMKKKHREAMTKCFTKNIERGIEEGFYRKNLNIDFIVKIHFAGIESIKEMEHQNNDINYKFNLATEYLEYHTRAIATEKGLETLNQILNNYKD